MSMTDGISDTDSAYKEFLASWQDMIGPSGKDSFVAGYCAKHNQFEIHDRAVTEELKAIRARIEVAMKALERVASGTCGNEQLFAQDSLAKLRGME